MRDKGMVIAGLVIFVGLVTFPIWYTLAAAGDRAMPELERPADASQCVEDTEFMTANHMELLNQWRDAVVRAGEKDYTSKAFGTHYEMSLTKTCLGCHGSRQAFCDRCHTYADVHPRCWECHVDPEGN